VRRGCHARSYRGSTSSTINTACLYAPSSKPFQAGNGYQKPSEPAGRHEEQGESGTERVGGTLTLLFSWMFMGEGEGGQRQQGGGGGGGFREEGGVREGETEVQGPKQGYLSHRNVFTGHVHMCTRAWPPGACPCRSCRGLPAQCHTHRRCGGCRACLGRSGPVPPRAASLYFSPTAPTGDPYITPNGSGERRTQTRTSPNQERHTPTLRDSRQHNCLSLASSESRAQVCVCERACNARELRSHLAAPDRLLDLRFAPPLPRSRQRLRPRLPSRRRRRWSLRA